MKFKLNNNILFLICFFLITSVLFFYSIAPVFLITPMGIISLLEKKLILTSIVLMLIIITPVLFLTLFFFYKYNSINKNKYKPNWCNSKKIEFLVWIIPIIIILILSLITFKTTYELDPYKSIISLNKPIDIQVISLDWKWLFIYPKEKIATINEISFPKNVPINFKITSNSVMNSFFIPKLGSQIYSMAGMESKLHLISNKPGNYEGFSSSFSGEGFSDMKFNVIVTKDNNEFNEWIKLIKMSKNTILNNNEFNYINQKSKNNPIKYFSKIKENLFEDVISNYMNKN